MNDQGMASQRSLGQMVQLQQDVILAPYTYFKIGGPAKYFYKPSNSEEFINVVIQAIKEGIKYFILGGGANLIVSDRGYDGLVIKSGGNNCRTLAPNRIITDSAVPLSRLVNYAKMNCLSGLELLAGIPGTVGGAVYGNAGGVDSAIGDRVIEVKIIDRTGKIKIIEATDCEFSYRHSRFKRSGETIIEVSFELERGNRERIQSIVNQNIANKKNRQPLTERSAGCIFQNPPGQSAGQLIEQAGLKGKKIGGASVSTKHANFIVNDGTATAEQIIMLISLIKQQIRDRYGVQLKEEVQLIGF